MNFNIEKMLAEMTPEEVLAAVQEEITKVAKEKKKIENKKAAREALKESIYNYMETVFEEEFNKEDTFEYLSSELDKIEALAEKVKHLDEDSDQLVKLVRGLF